MLAYIATKRQFLEDAPTIEEKVKSAVQQQLSLSISSHSSEYLSWHNSLGDAMSRVLDSEDVPADAGVAVEYRIHGRRQRIDVMVSGRGEDGVRDIVLVELKQWTSVSPSPLDDHVLTYLGGSEVETRHPSYQAWTYARMLEDFYEVVTSEPIRVHPCAFVHNCTDDSVLRGGSSTRYQERAPTFLRGEHSQLRRYISDSISAGDRAEGLRRLDASVITPSQGLVSALSSMLDGNETFVLIDDQKTAFETIMRAVREAPLGERWVVLVKGGPGTGKSVIAINALVRLLEDGLNVRYVTKNAAPRAVYQSQLRGRSDRAEISNLFVSSDAFYKVEQDAYDVLLVDEAHRLMHHSGIYRNLGENQIAEIVQAARVSVFFLDESQRVTWLDIGSDDSIRGIASQAEAPVQEVELTAQFRCAGSDDYLRWVDAVLGISDEVPPSLAETTYQVSIMDTPSELRDRIFSLEQTDRTSRLLAGYCWDWVSKRNPRAFDIEFPDDDFAMQWNLSKDGPGWMISPYAVNQVGCIHTCQGLEGDYMGVIIGPDLLFRDGKATTNPGARSRMDQSLRGWKSAAKVDREGTLARTDELIRNTYRTLLTRGMRGTFIYSTDVETKEHLKELLLRAGHRSDMRP